MTSEDTVVDPLMSVQFYVKTVKVFSFRVTVHLLFSFLLQKTVESVFQPIYESLKLSHKPWHKIFDDFWRHGWRSVDELSILFKEQFFLILCFSPSTVFIFIAKDA